MQDADVVSGLIVCDTDGCHSLSSPAAPRCSLIPAIALYSNSLAVVCGGADETLVCRGVDGCWCVVWVHTHMSKQRELREREREGDQV